MQHQEKKMNNKINLYQIFRQTAERQPEHPAYIGPGDDDICSYRQLQERIDASAEKLKSSGLQKGTCVGLHYRTSLEYIVMAYAIWSCGAIVVPIAIELVPEEKRKICEDISLQSVICNVNAINIFKSFAEGEAKDLGENIVYNPIKSLREHPPGISDINTAFIRFTSGTTSASKGVILSHESVYERITAANGGLHIGRSDTILWLLSMSYHFTVSIVSYLSFGATIVVCRDHFGSTIIRTAARHKATFIYGSPVHYNSMAQNSGSQMLPDVRLAISTATQLRGDIADAFFKRFGIPLNEAYGIIEVGLPCINIDKPFEKRGSVGRTLPAYQLRLHDIGLGPGLKSIKVRGKGFLDAYYDPWQTRKDIMPDGWFATGDLGKLDGEGYLYILGRSKEMISVAGMKFFPQETEVVLESHPCVKEAYVFPSASERFGEVPNAHVVLEEGLKETPSSSELRGYCKQHLTYYKIPEVIEYVDALPRTASGKLIRQK